ncbi:hypothetical protein [Nocardioides sp. L-11A]|uniref:hypothetical protein n=1 Tax=Nocardioides sp. L-11A TaxID=3043848 RepID=UPI00249AE6E2|nr:hypothetical protein QJ852_23040 [Nocardioides sp. L-11A]
MTGHRAISGAPQPGPLPTVLADTAGWVKIGIEHVGPTLRASSLASALRRVGAAEGEAVFARRSGGRICLASYGETVELSEASAELIRATFHYTVG